MKTPVLLVTSIFFCVAGASAQDWIETAPVPDPPLYPKTALPSPPIDSLFGFSIDRDAHNLRMYDLGDAEALVQEYKSGGMKWFYPRHQPELFYPVLDSNLIPLIEYRFGFRRNPVMTSQAALAFYTAYVETGSEEHLQGFMNNVDWLLDNHDDFYFRYDFPWSHGGRALNSGWVSAMAQGEALAAMSSAYFLTGESQYLDAATGIFQTLHSNSDSTWSIYADEHQYYWLEEYPNPDLCHVLNGMLFGLWGLWDYYAITGDPFALDLFRAGIQTVADHYDAWNIRDQNASRYCLHGIHFPFYHETHIRQFEAYLQHFDIPEFAAAIDLFTRVPMIAISTLELDFGDVRIGESGEQEFVLYNTGRGPVDVTEISLTSPFFDVSTSAASIPEEDSLVVTATFTPSTPGRYAGNILVKSNAGAFPIDVAGYGVDSRIAIEERELGFGDVLALSSDTLRLHVENTSMADIRLDSAVAPSGVFHLAEGDHVLDVGIRTALSAVFAPSEVGVFTDTLSIYFDSGISMHPIPVSGTSVSPLRLVADPVADEDGEALDFGNVMLGRSDTLAAKLINIGSAPISFFEASVSPSSSFHVLDREGIVEPGNEWSLSVVFATTAAGLFHDTLSVYTNLTADPLRLALRGAVVADVAAGDETEIPSRYSLEQNFPNPFNRLTTVRYSLPEQTHVRITLVNAVGQIVRVVSNREERVGMHSVAIDMSGLPAGIYYYRVETEAYRATRSMVFVR